MAKTEEIESEIDSAIGKEINDREFRVVLPKHDNDGRPIKADLIEDISVDISERFGGVTVFPSVAGCWVAEEGDESELMCEENLIISTVRDSEDGVSYNKDEEWIHELAADAGLDLGQYAIMVSEDVVEADFVPGEFKERIDDENVGQNVFRKLL